LRALGFRFLDALVGTRLAMRAQFRHDYAEGIVLYTETASALVPDTLIVAANIPLDHGAAGYDPGKIEQLTADISAYTHKHNITELVMAQGEIREHRA
jgi:hypothetical protein